MEQNDNYPNKAGIYKFTCINNGKIYIGKSVSIYHRMANHKCISKKPSGKCYFENALIKHGWDSFTVEVLEIFENFDKTKLEDRLMILDVETSYMDLFDSRNKNKGYNICKYSNDNTGVPLTEEHKEKIRVANVGKFRSEETKKRMSVSRMGRVFSDETKDKIRQSKVGKTFSDEHKEKIRKSNLGKTKSEKQLEKMRNRRHSDETKEKMSRSQLGRKHEESTKEKIRQAKLGKPMKPFSEEHKANMRKPKSEEAKANMRLARLARIDKHI